MKTKFMLLSLIVTWIWTSGMAMPAYPSGSPSTTDNYAGESGKPARSECPKMNAVDGIKGFTLSYPECSQLSLNPDDQDKVLYIGLSQADISIDGKNNPDDPVYVKAIVFRQGNQQAALVICDLISVSGESNILTRELVSERSGIPVQNICISATHTHTNSNSPRFSELAERISEAVLKAQSSAKPLKIMVGKGFRDDLSFNRRFLLKDGTVMSIPGELNPDIIKPVGPIDPEIGIMLFRNLSDNKPVGMLSTFPLHADCSRGKGSYKSQVKPKEPTQRSADYPYWLARSMQESFGTDFISVFGEPFCEDLDNTDFFRPWAYGTKTRGQFMLSEYTPRVTDATPSPSTPKYVGDELAKTIKAGIADLKEEIPSLRVCSNIIHVPIGTFSSMDLEWAKATQGQKDISSLTQYRMQRILTLEKLRNRYGNTIPVTVQVIRISKNTAIVTLPGQIFVELGLALKEASPFANTILIELANETIPLALIPPRKSFVEGHFEVIDSYLESGSGEIMVEEAVRILKDLYNAR